MSAIKQIKAEPLSSYEMQDIVRKLGGADRARRFLRGELIVSEQGLAWRREGHIIYFSITSDGTTGPEWITRLASKGFSVGNQIKDLLRSDNFKPTSGQQFEVAVLMGSIFQRNTDRTTEGIQAEAKRLGFAQPTSELACLIRDRFPNQELKAMRLDNIVVLHEPFHDEEYDQMLVTKVSIGGGLESTEYIEWEQWRDYNGFAFVACQTQT